MVHDTGKTGISCGMCGSGVRWGTSGRALNHRFNTEAQKFESAHWCHRSTSVKTFNFLITPTFPAEITPATKTLPPSRSAPAAASYVITDLGALNIDDQFSQ